MHKVLRSTELAQLRALGYEVFSPAYLSPIYDQSADRTVDVDQPTTLPNEIFETLLNYNFFYNKITPEISEILNTFFDHAIVTISALWLQSFMEAYDGPIIYRVYGQPYSLSEKIIEFGFWEKLIARDNFCVVPFAAETLDREHAWFTALCEEAVPYQLADDVFTYTGIWHHTAHRRRISTHIPNIENPYYAAAYSTFRAQYPQKIFEITGPQRTHPVDASIIGALPRAELLRSYATSSGFLYNYTDQVCYLTPIEMMEIGGPVLYAPGSLLARFYGGRTPGLVTNPIIGETKLKALLDSDNTFVSEIISAQEPVRRRYDRAIVQPQFAQVFTRLLDEAPPRKAAFTVQHRVLRGAAGTYDTTTPPTRFAVLLHDSGMFERDGPEAIAFDRIGRAMERLIRSVATGTKHRVLLTCLDPAKALMLDLFADLIATDRVELRTIPMPGIPSTALAERIARLDVIAELNRRSDVETILIPHPNRFPEALLCKAERITYVGEYQPLGERRYAFPFEREQDLEFEDVTCASLASSKLIIASSDYTKRCILAADSLGNKVEGKVVVMADAIASPNRVPLHTWREPEFNSRIAKRPFLFYPAVNAPSKNYAFMLQVFAAIRLQHPDLALVLTDALGRIPGVGELADLHNLKSHIIVFDDLKPCDIRWMYANAAVLCVTSEFEATPPQPIIEALKHNVPVVSTRLPAITDRLGDGADSLALCRSLDLGAFIDTLHNVLRNRAQVVDRQSRALSCLTDADTNCTSIAISRLHADISSRT